MIKPIERVLDDIRNGLIKPEIVLKEWGLSIVEECAGSFEVTMEDDEPEDDMSYSAGEHPVLVRQSVLDVKEQIK